jgi:hypothetical protein
MQLGGRRIMIGQITEVAVDLSLSMRVAIEQGGGLSDGGFTPKKNSDPS